MSIVSDFKSIRLKVERLEQKAQADKEQAAVDALKASLAFPYGVSVPYSAAFNEAARKFMAGNSQGFNIPDLRGRVKANG